MDFQSVFELLVISDLYISINLYLVPKKKSGAVSQGKLTAPVEK
jgi:hypothetical protein